MKRIKYLLLIIVITFISISNVKAEEINECYNDYLIDVTWGSNIVRYNVSTDTWKKWGSTSSGVAYGLQHLFTIEPGKTYYMKGFNDRILDETTFTFWGVHFYDSNKNFLDTSQIIGGNVINNHLSFSIYSYNFPKNAVYVSFDFPAKIRTYLGSTIAFADFDLSSCPPGTEPEEPEEPEEPVIIPDTTLDNFYSIYTSKIQEISQYAQENKFILSSICIVLSIIIVNLFLYLFNKGGYK